MKAGAVLSAETAQRYRQVFLEDGFLIVPAFLDPEETAEVREQAQRYISDVVPDAPADFAFYEDAGRPETLRQVNNMQLRDRYFAELYGHSRWRLLAEVVLGEPATCIGMQWYNKPPGTEHATPAHQDNASMNLDPANAVAMWLALDPVDSKNGCLRYIRGSQAEGLQRHVSRPVLGFSRRIERLDETMLECEVAVAMEPGDLVMHGPLTIHRADANRSPRPRRALLQLFAGASCRIDEDGLRGYEAELTETRRQLGQGAYRFAKFRP